MPRRGSRLATRHGTLTQYNYGCKCDKCREVKVKSVQRRREEKKREEEVAITIRMPQSETDI